VPALVFRKGLDLKDAVAGMLAENYHSDLVDRIKAENFTYQSGRLTVRLAREFGFCYGVDRAVDYAYQTRKRFPNRAVYLTGEIIHNPHVNENLRAMGIGFLSDPGSGVNRVHPDDVVILPAFGVTMAMLEQLDRRGCAVSPGFDPDRDLVSVGLANQTTMLMSESLEIEGMLKAAMQDRYGAEGLARHFQAFDTICSATQDRQDAVVALLREEPIDLMIVIGGYNSSNTCNLARICSAARPTFHVAEPECLVSADEIRHRPVGLKVEVTTKNWLPEGRLSVGLTSGASTPDNLVGEAIRRLEAFCS
jgi:4-hydroxy-3-methylbut-2-enyl diphosphate reductase IspH